ESFKVPAVLLQQLRLVARHQLGGEVHRGGVIECAQIGETTLREPGIGRRRGRALEGSAAARRIFGIVAILVELVPDLRSPVRIALTLVEAGDQLQQRPLKAHRVSPVGNTSNRCSLRSRTRTAPNRWSASPSRWTRRSTSAVVIRGKR